MCLHKFYDYYKSTENKELDERRGVPKKITFNFFFDSFPLLFGAGLAAKPSTGMDHEASAPMFT